MVKHLHRQLSLLSLNGSTGCGDAAAKLIGSKCGGVLTRLSLDHLSRLTSTGLRDIGKGCPSLQQLSLVGCTKIDSEAMKCVAHSSLTSLAMDGCVAAVTDEVISEIGAHCAMLSRLRVVRCQQVGSQGIEALAMGCRRLVHLDIRNCNLVETRGFATLASCCAQLKHLAVAGCKSFDDDSAVEISVGCPKLEHLDVSECRQLTPSGFLEIGSRCLELRSLFACATCISDGTLVVLSGACKLEELVVSECELVTDVGVRSLVDSGSLKLLGITHAIRVSAQALEELQQGGRIAIIPVSYTHLTLPTKRIV
eukprot:TRINITY_DN19530_c0_g1_i1.p1 TRINITY_DN19530_c0_g1~~TRINITY_DN19530_c0_g1_i1.p1  ORF type:complete len:310 (-),score=45.27 TRINITY_DN19530_c0_g1_i1:123-1052(-)